MSQFSKIFLSLTIVCQVLNAQSQALVIGEFDGLIITEINESFAPFTAALLDLDCDDLVDLSLSAEDNILGSWERWSMNLYEGVEVHNSNIGAPTLFQNGDTVNNTADQWTTALDFIYGTGEAGSYGHLSIDSSYIIFRKIYGPDTAYLFILVSSVGIDFTIHEVISACNTPLISVVAWNIESNNKILKAHPNPVKDFLFWESGDETIQSVYAISIDGHTYPLTFSQSGSNLSQLPPGLYTLMLHSISEHYTTRIIKL